MMRQSCKPFLYFGLLILFWGGFTGCTLPENLPLPSTTGEAVSLYETVSVLLTETAAVSILETRTPTEPAAEGDSPDSLSATPSKAARTPAPLASSQAAATATAFPPAKPTPLCDLAGAGIPFDVSIPDDTRLKPGESFVKTWRLVNAGSCAWTTDYALLFFSGTDMAAHREEPFRQAVRPGEALEVSLDMVAPLAPGTYQANYKLRGNAGQLFGIGPEGGAPFWVRIVVAAAATPSATAPLPTVTPTAEVYREGNAVVAVEESYDLDAGAAGGGMDADFVIQLRDGQAEWVNLNGATVLVYGSTQPDLQACKTAGVSGEALVMGAELEGSYLCARTGRGFPARIYLERIDWEVPALTIRFVVWTAP